MMMQLHSKHNQKTHGNRGSLNTIAIADSQDWVREDLSFADRAVMDKWQNAERVSLSKVEKIAKTAPMYKGDISRGLSFATTAQRDDFVKGLQGAGGMQTTKTASFSAKDSVAHVFSGSSEKGVVLNVKSKTGRAIMGLDGKRVEQGEYEVISLKGTGYKLTSPPKSETITITTSGRSSKRKVISMELEEL